MTRPPNFIAWAGLLLLLQLFHKHAFAASLDEWRSRSIYQILTDRFALSNGSTSQPCNVVDGLYCGGSWKGIEVHLDYIQGMNFDAIWISPIVAQLPQQTGDGEAYTGYWQQNLYTLNSHFGEADDLKQLISAVHDRGMFMMLDVVVNHMGYSGSPQNVDYSIFRPFNDSKYFHDYCQITNTSNQTNLEVCWLGDNIVPLVDLRTEDQIVQDMYGEWIAGMVQTYSIDGLRIDTSLNVQPSFFTNFVDAAGVFSTGEVMQGDSSVACQWAETIGSILNYPVYYPLIRAFGSSNGNINDLVTTIYATQANCPDPISLATFSENHDVPRFANITSDVARAKNVIAYTIMADGIPIIYQGQEQHESGGVSPYFNRAPLWLANYNTEAQLYKYIANLNQARQHIIVNSKTYTSWLTEVIYQDYHTFAMRKGANGSQVITVLTNNGENEDDWTLDLENHGFTSGTQVTDILTCTEMTVNSSGVLSIPMRSGLPKVIYPTQLLQNSSLCGIKSLDAASMTAVITSYATSIHGQPTLLSTTMTETVPAAQTDLPSSSTSVGFAAKHAGSIMRDDGTTPMAVMIASLTSFMLSILL